MFIDKALIARYSSFLSFRSYGPQAQRVARLLRATKREKACPEEFEGSFVLNIKPSFSIINSILKLLHVI